MKRSREHFVTCGQMKILEQRADADGLSYYQMMENAGTRAAEMIIGKFAAGDDVVLYPEETASELSDSCRGISGSRRRAACNRRQHCESRTDQR